MLETFNLLAAISRFLSSVIDLIDLVIAWWKSRY
jgi:hypothetical protein